MSDGEGRNLALQKEFRLAGSDLGNAGRKSGRFFADRKNWANTNRGMAAKERSSTGGDR
jgi:hypothetical protein